MKRSVKLCLLPDSTPDRIRLYSLELLAEDRQELLTEMTYYELQELRNAIEDYIEKQLNEGHYTRTYEIGD